MQTHRNVCVREHTLHVAVAQHAIHAWQCLLYDSSRLNRLQRYTYRLFHLAAACLRACAWSSSAPSAAAWSACKAARWASAAAVAASCSLAAAAS